MKNLRKCTMLSLLLFLFAIITSACGSGGGNGGEFMYLPNIVTLSKDKFEIDIGKKDKVTAYIGGIDITKDATFEIVTESNQKDTVATIDNDGTITAIAVGTANIKVSYKQAESANFNVLVKDPTIPNTEVKTNDIYYELGDDTKDIDKIVVTVNGKDKTSEAKFFSSDESVVKVDRNGKITFVGEGQATIIVHVDGANDSIININVQKPQLDISIDEDKIEFGKEFYIELGETKKLDVKLREEDKTSKATYTSSDPSVVTVDENGNITALKEGEAEITVIVDGAKEAKIPVVVPHQGPVYPQAGLKILLGNTDKLDIMLRGENVTSQCPLTIHKIHENDPDIITIDENGNITSLAIGEVFITTICNGDEITIPIKVYDELTTVARNNKGEIIQVNTKYLHEEDTEILKTILHDTGFSENKDDIQKVIQIDNINDLQNLNIDIDLEDGTQVAIIHKQEDGTLKYISTETVQGKKITKNDIDSANIKDVSLNILLGNTNTLEIEPHEIFVNIDNNGIVTVNEGSITGDKVGNGLIKTTYNGKDAFIKINVYDTLTTNATNSAGEPIEVNTKILSPTETDKMVNLLYDTKMIESKDDVQKVITIDNIDDLNNIAIDIDLPDGTQVAIVHKQEDGTLKYISTEAVQGKKINKNDIDSNEIKEVAFNIMLGNTRPFELNPYTVIENNGIVTIGNGTIKGDKAGTASITTIINGEEILVKANVYDTLTTSATNSDGEAIEVNTKILSPTDTGKMINLLYDTGIIANKNDVQKVITIDNIDDLNSLDIDIDLEDGTKVAIVHIEEDGTLNYISTETVQGNKITKNDINSNNIQEVGFNLYIGDTVQLEIPKSELTISNNGIVSIDNNYNMTAIGGGDTTITTTLGGKNVAIKIDVYNATDLNGNPIKVNTTTLSDSEASTIKTILRDNGIIDNENAVSKVVQINQPTNNISDIHFNVDGATNGSKVAVISNEGGRLIYYLTDGTAINGFVEVDNVNTQPKTQVATINANGQPEIYYTTAGFYNANNQLIADWTTCNNWRPNWWLEAAGANHLMSAHSDLIQATKLVIPEGVNALGDNQVFLQCGPLTSENLNSQLRVIVLPNSLQEMGIALPLLSNSGLVLTNVNIRSDNPHYTSIDGVIYSKNLTTLYLCPTNKTRWSVPNHVTRIANQAFEFNQTTSFGPAGSNADIILPNTIKSIGVAAFAQEANLKWIELPDGVTTFDVPDNIGDYGAVNQVLHSIFVPNSVTTNGSVVINCPTCTIYRENQGYSRTWFRQNREN